MTNITIRHGADAALCRVAYDFYLRYSTGRISEAPADDAPQILPGYTGGTQAELRFLPVTPEVWNGWLTGPGRFTVTAWQGDTLVGLCAGAEDRPAGAAAPNRQCGYLSYLCVAPSVRRQGIGSRLLHELETVLAARPGVEKVEVVFHNPVHLPWCLPGTEGDWHPCLPGVDMASGLYLLLKNRGWRDFAQQNVYHQRLVGYQDPPSLAASRARLTAEGIEVTLYRPDQHRGLADLFVNIRNPGWGAQVLAHTDRPIVVAVDHGANDLVVSYTGPLSVEGTPGRGNFCGIGTRTEYRGRGIGKLVFCEMCRRHGEAGADFMSLYTGETNPARNIYEAAGFRIVRCCADMRKEVCGTWTNGY